ncbi:MULTISPECIES: hypothetical protein [unclassified Paenibacillus]|uniref:hypothetical protein n=1 Tax=unclassified Paenibacillus TaxID=185978 RepID=UPI000CFB8197|nr:MULTISPECIES: hypothetical protein [unclassified Paenibacillus]PRA08427.1 hypothetical protein CQ043_00020 [Paenibacillus sp. MYb63]PRA42255.1 hypothetical protein CQ061_29380 [Paenibacillus sp. MYb67]QZN78270.1 hypothetical protein K5K90_14405 [Paenibacillus sp. DR312]
MFNRGGFNRMAFNRQISVFVFGRAVADVSGSAAAVGTMEMTGSARLWMWQPMLRRLHLRGYETGYHGC